MTTATQQSISAAWNGSTSEHNPIKADVVAVVQDIESRLPGSDRDIAAQSLAVGSGGVNVTDGTPKVTLVDNSGGSQSTAEMAINPDFDGVQDFPNWGLSFTPSGSTSRGLSVSYSDDSTLLWRNSSGSYPVLNSGMRAGDIGVPCMMKNLSGSAIAANGQVAGTSLQFSASGNGGGVSSNGTWICLGECPDNQTSLFMRIA